MLEIKMKDPTLKDIKNFNRNKSQTGKLNFSTKKEIYNWLVNFLDRVRYKKLEKKDKCQVMMFLNSITDYRPSYLRKLVARATQKELKSKKYTRTTPNSKYDSMDVRLLANTDVVHSRLNASATKHILKREYELYGKNEFENISQVSKSHIYNLREREVYNCVYRNKTKANTVNIGYTAKPKHNNIPGSIRVDTVHQRDIYYINAVDEITQWELVFAVPVISQLFLIPILELMLKSFPFKIFNFHSDRGSEYINYKLADILRRLMINQTKSRSRHSNDQALIECKNGWVVRKHMGYGYIAEDVAPLVNKFCVEYLNIYINFHRPCGYRNISIQEKTGKVVYDKYCTPFEMLSSIKNVKEYLVTPLTDLKKIEMETSFHLQVQQLEYKYYEKLQTPNCCRSQSNRSIA
jgi:hypothetical protein